MLAMTLMMLIGCTLCVNADSKTLTVGKDKVTYSMPSSVTAERGETKVIPVDMSDERGRYTCRIQWGYMSDDINVIDVGNGSDWGHKAQLEFTAGEPVTTDVDALIWVLDKDGNDVGQVLLTCKVNVVEKNNSSNSSNTQPVNPTTKPSTPVKKTVALKSISLSKSKLSLNTGKSGKLTVKYNPFNTTVKKAVAWKSSNTKVATVKAGTVTAKKAGTTTITATVAGKKASCKVTVKKAAKKPSKKPSKKPTKGGGKYVSASAAYTHTNNFRTSKKVWQWNKDNKTKTYFNTKKSNTLKPLKKSAKLEKIAKTRAKEISKKFSHTRPNGQSCFSLYPKNTYLGENIAYNHGGDGKYVVEQWKESNQKYGGQGHRRAMLNSNFNSIGIACYEVNGVRYWVQCFAKL